MGVTKSILQTFVGFFVFEGVKLHPVNITGLFINILGGLVYAYVKYKERSSPPGAENRKIDASVSNSKKFIV